MTRNEKHLKTHTKILCDLNIYKYLDALEACLEEFFLKVFPFLFENHSLSVLHKWD
jgi:hypothetical protein